MSATPGPWLVNVWTTGRRTVEDTNGLVICEVHPVHDPVGKVYNAHLIACAPMMRDTLEQILALINEGAPDWMMDLAVKNAVSEVGRWTPTPRPAG